MSEQHTIHIPKAGERVLITEIAPFDPCPHVAVGDVVTVRYAFGMTNVGQIARDDESPAWLQLSAEVGIDRGGATWCRCEPLMRLVRDDDETPPPPVTDAVVTLAMTCAFVVCGVLAGCGSPSAVGAYLEGVRDAIEQSGDTGRRPPTVVIDWHQDVAALGECKRIDGAPVVYVHAGAILRTGRDVEERRTLLRDVIAHELGHAALSCSDADHAVIR